jgi:Fe-S cluster assembly iron-binding protein IscA
MKKFYSTITKRIIEKAPFKLTESAATRIKDLMNEKKESLGLKIGVNKRGCNGLSYTMNYVNEEPKSTLKVEDKGII